MAKTASAEGLARDENGPDYEGALGTVKKIMAIEQRAKSEGGNAKTHWDNLDNLRVDRGAARILKTVLAKEPDNRVMILRGFFGLLIAAQENGDLELDGDMVDRMHKAIPQGVHIETPGAVRPIARSAPKPDAPLPGSADVDEDREDQGDGDEDAEEGDALEPAPEPEAPATETKADDFQEDPDNVVALRRQNVTGKPPTEEPVGNDLGAPQPDSESGDTDAQASTGK